MKHVKAQNYLLMTLYHTYCIFHLKIFHLKRFHLKRLQHRYNMETIVETYICVTLKSKTTVPCGMLRYSLSAKQFYNAIAS